MPKIMKQKIVVRVQMMQDPKKRAKALKLAVGIPGVLSAGIDARDENQIVVVGEGVDSVALTRLLRKRLGSAELICVSSSDKNKLEEFTTTQEPMKKNGGMHEGAAAMEVWPFYGGGHNYNYNYNPVQPPRYYVDEVPEQYQDPGCSIM